jgi:hypothetical protein
MAGDTTVMDLEDKQDEEDKVVKEIR